MAEPEKNEHSEEQFDDLSLEELLRGAREEIARVDAMMGNPADEPVQEPDAADALDAAGKARMRLWSAVTVDCPYPMLERLKLLAAAHGGTVEGTDFGAAVSVRILLPQENAASFDAALTELSAGTMTARREGERFLPGPRE